MSKKTRKSVRFIFCLVPLVCLIILSGYYFFLLQPVDSPSSARTEQFIVSTGATSRSVGRDLMHKKLIRSGLIFYLTARYPFVYGHFRSSVLKSGVYRISSSMSVREITALLESGKQDYIRLSVPEGLTIGKIAQHLDDAGICPAAAFKKAVTDQSVIAEYAVPANSLEGYLFPDTYYFLPDMDALVVVRTMVNNFFRQIKNISGLDQLPPGKLHNVVILASVVEREYRVDEEAPLIASVFTNRIKKHEGLYSCATIEYIITEIQGKNHPDVITYDDLKINNPYNTYRWAGLPPGPIANPGTVALQAAASPPVTDYYYFRLTDPEKGTHTFTKTFSAHTDVGKKMYTKKVLSVK
jgi:UPF0755 protein